MLPHRHKYSPGPKSQKQKSEEAAKKHAVAEQLRRQRIKDHLYALQEHLVPNRTSRMVKEAVLSETVRRVKELRKRAYDVALRGDREGRCSFTFPGDSDEATVSCCEGGGGKTVKATVCCEDRPGLNRDLTEAIRAVGARAVRAEMATIGGRTKAEVVVQWLEGGGEEDVGSLRRALKTLVDSGASDSSGLARILTMNRNTGFGLEILPSNVRARIGGSSFNSMRNGKSF